MAAPAPGKMHGFSALREPFGSIHFAGTETALHHYGTMAGAVDSGIRAAVEVLQELKPQAKPPFELVATLPHSCVADYPSRIALQGGGGTEG